MKGMRRWFYIGLAVIALLEAIAPFVLYHDEPHFRFENLPAWGSIYGLVSCVVIIVGSKLIGKLWLMRREDYYDR